MEGKPALTTEDSALEQMMQVCKPIFSFKHLGSYNIIYVLPYKRIKDFDIPVCICIERFRKFKIYFCFCVNVLYVDFEFCVNRLTQR